MRYLKKLNGHLASVTNQIISLTKQVNSLRLNVYSLLMILVCKFVVGVLEVCHDIIEHIVHQVFQHGSVDRCLMQMLLVLRVELDVHLLLVVQLLLFVLHFLVLLLGLWFVH